MLLLFRLGVQTQAGEIFIRLQEAVVSPALLIKPGLIVSLAGEEGPLCVRMAPRRNEAEWRWEISDGG